ncbi:MAG TPA: hypothetical protein GX707_02825 [Epulopiscium sp.]|nr:hypothetical protein [Candidatus Epulonipiscium sp.]
MKVRLVNDTKHARRIIILITILIITIFSSACAKKSKGNIVIYNLDDYSPYPKVVKKIFPSFTVEQADNKAYYTLDAGDITEAFDTQAAGALETKIAKHWYPQYLATVIIAVDRNQTNAIVASWSDLFASQQEIGFFDMPGNIQMFTAAMSYGLEGEDYSLTKTIQLLTSLHDNNLLKINSFESPIIICFDYQATALIESRRNIEIIIPTEGTLTYEKGLLSNEKLSFEGNVDKLLFDSKLRLLDGQSDLSIYPNKTAYSPATRVTDYKHFAKTTQNVSRLIERNVLGSRRYMSIDNWEHLHFALIYIIIITVWIVSIMRRSMQKGITYAAFSTGVLLIGWTFIRLIKYQIDFNPLLSRYLWYGFYFFQLTLPLVLLWMAWAIDKPENEIFPPKWWQYITIFISILIMLVFTNDLHGFVLRLDMSSPDWDIHYGYGLGYYVILFVCMINLAMVFVILIQKSIKNPRKKGVILPLILFFIFGVYNYKYIIRDPFVYATDITIITGLFTMFMFEICIRSGLIPVNTKYIKLFIRSPLKIQIINNKGEIVLTSLSATPLSEDVIDKVLATSSVSILQDDDSVLFANSIPGGYAICHEDVSKLSKLYRKIHKSTQMLKKANAILAEEEKLKRSINEKDAKKQLMEQLENEIAESIGQMSSMIEVLPNLKDHSQKAIRIALLLCYIKRRCNLFFREKETNTIAINELIIYIDELTEIAKYSNIQIINVNQIKGSMDIRQGTLFYDFFYAVIDLAIQTGCTYVIGNFEANEKFFVMRFLPSKDIGTFKLKSKLIAAIAAAKGEIVTKKLEDTIGINISFPKGGNTYD